MYKYVSGSKPQVLWVTLSQSLKALEGDSADPSAKLRTQLPRLLVSFDLIGKHVKRVIIVRPTYRTLFSGSVVGILVDGEDKRGRTQATPLVVLEVVSRCNAMICTLRWERCHASSMASLTARSATTSRVTAEMGTFSILGMRSFEVPSIDHSVPFHHRLPKSCGPTLEDPRPHPSPKADSPSPREGAGKGDACARLRRGFRMAQTLDGAAGLIDRL